MSNPRSTAAIAGHPLHPMLVPFPIACFTGALVVDLVYSQTMESFWFTASLYLLGAGVVMALLAAVMGFTDFLGEPRIRALTVAWAHMLGNLLLVLIEAYNWYQRFSLGSDAILSTGLILSAVAVVIMLVTGWLGWEMVYRRHVGISDEVPAEREIFHMPPGTAAHR